MLTPEDIEAVRFSVGFRGYRQEEVDAFLDRVSVDLRQRRALHDGALQELEELRRENERLRQSASSASAEHVRSLEAELERHRREHGELAAGSSIGGTPGPSDAGQRSTLEMAFDYMARLPGSQHASADEDEEQEGTAQAEAPRPEQREAPDSSSLFDDYDR